MNKITKQHLTMYHSLMEEIEKILDRICNYRNISSPGIEKCTIAITATHIEIGWEVSCCSCCSDEYFCEEIPIEYLFNDNWFFDFEKEENKIMKRQLEEQARRKKEQEERDRQKRLQQFKKLKEEFDNE